MCGEAYNSEEALKGLTTGQPVRVPKHEVCLAAHVACESAQASAEAEMYLVREYRKPVAGATSVSE